MLQRQYARSFSRQRITVGAGVSIEHELQHLDLHEIITSRRAITQTIAADLFDRGAGAVRFRPAWTAARASLSSRGRGTASLAGDLIALTDPPPEPLTNVTTPWGLMLEPAP